MPKKIEITVVYDPEKDEIHGGQSSWLTTRNALVESFYLALNDARKAYRA